MKLPFEIDLNGKTAVVTGGAGVLCSAFARILGACGAKIAVLDLNRDAANEVAESIVKQGGKAIGVEANVLDRNSLLKARDRVNHELGTCDILINGAGGN
ncbi:MAG: SDR family NAD(P)-dependent oxidoreductase, partial [Eubacteriales bacterium]